MKPQDVTKNILSFWDGLNKKERIGFAGGLAAIVLVVLWFGVWAFSSSYHVLFADLDPRDASTIVEELRRMKVSYRLEDGGTKVLVDEKLVHETRLRLMAHGAALNGGVGFEIFDNKDAGMTEYTQKINYQRALQGELARTIMAIEQVKHARVHLVVSEAGLFRRDKSKPKASVSLVLKPGARMSGDQIVGIQRLVAAAVPNLEPNLVTVLDQRGVTLSPIVEADEELAAASGKLKLKKTTEDYLARKIAELMDRTFGPGQAIVSVDATLNFDEVRRTLQSIIPLRPGSGEEAGAVIRKRQSSYRQPKAGATKVAEGEEYAGGSASNVTSTTEVEYEVGKSVEQIVSAPGGIRRISVGVVVPAHLGEEQVERIRSIVRMAVGFNAERGDAISVQPIDQLVMKDNSSGAAASADPASDSIEQDPSVSTIVRGIVSSQPVLLLAALSAVLAGLGVLWMTGRRSRRTALVAQNQVMSDEQRHRLLTDIQTWIESEKISAGGVKL